MTTATANEITIRRATGDDAEALSRLAGRDSKRLPGDHFLLAEVDGEAWAAVGIRTRVVLADPFRPSAEVAELLSLRARRLRRHSAPRRSPFRLARRVAA